MEVWSFAEVGTQLQPVKIEVSLMAGLPEFVITGLPDQTIKESLIRIKSALRHQGFQTPKAEKVFINLTPNDEKKRGRGIELGIALAYLAETGQLSVRDVDRIYAYGELGLKGDVRFLEEINWAPIPVGSMVWSGYPESETCDHSLRALRSLADVQAPDTLESGGPEPEELAREFGEITWSPETARLLSVLAAGGHHALLAGPSGSGKSTLAKSLHLLLPDLDEAAQKELRKWDRYFQRDPLFRPFENPHHTSTVQALLGGGTPPEPGVITRAHHGLLLMDEFLEFPQRVREGMREALENSHITIARKGAIEKLPAEFQLIATTNLCPCGDFVPGRMGLSCRFTLNKCQSYQERLSGPILDRFDVLALSNAWGRKGVVGLPAIFEQVVAAHSYRIERGQNIPNGRLTWDVVLKDLEHQGLEQFLPSTMKSRRRGLSILRVARTLADLEATPKIRLSHINEATAYAWTTFF